MNYRNYDYRNRKVFICVFKFRISLDPLQTFGEENVHDSITLNVTDLQ
jgi:hypothetical protein